MSSQFMALGPYHIPLATHSENLLSGLVLVALLTYFYVAFGKLIQTGGDKLADRRMESRVYYSSAAAV